MHHSASVLPFLRLRKPKEDWTQRELAEFYRVEGALVQAGMAVWTDRGVSDEGEPWFVFGREDNDEIIAHFARIDGRYLIVSSVFPDVVSGTNFTSLITDLLNAHPYVVARAAEKRRLGNVLLHPSALLTILLATAFAKTAEVQDHQQSAANQEGKDAWSFLHRFELALISAVAMVAVSDSQVADGSLKGLNAIALLQDAQHSSDDLPRHVAADHDRDPTQLAHSGALLTPHGHGSDVVQQVAGLEVQDQSREMQSQQSPAVLHLAAQTPAKSDEAGHDVHQVKESYDDSSGIHLITLDNLSNTGDIHLRFADSDANSATAHVLGVSDHLDENQPPSHSDIGSTTLQKATSVDLGTGSEAFSALGVSSTTITVLPAADLNSAISASLSLAGYGHTSVLSSDVSLSLLHSASINTSNTQPTVADAVPGVAAPALVNLGSQDSVHQIVNDFLAHTPDYKVVLSGTEFIIVDAHTADFSDKNFQAETFHMPDGSSLTLIGVLPPQHILTAA
jgi:hypothetical protein